MSLFSYLHVCINYLSQGVFIFFYSRQEILNLAGVSGFSRFGEFWRVKIFQNKTGIAENKNIL